MFSHSGKTFLIGLVLAASVEAAPDHMRDRPGRDVVYGNDNRMDVYQNEDPLLAQLARSTVALMLAERVVIDGSGIAQIRTSAYGDGMGLCTDEPFYGQPTAAHCSGSLVGPNLILTAGHCISSGYECSNTKFVFGFNLDGTNTGHTVLESDVYHCNRVIKRVLEHTGEDYALVELDREVVGREPLQINRDGYISEGTELVVIGHPSGLPTKIAPGARVRSANNPYFFVANLDTYGGNSGSAVFNFHTGMIEGVLVRGEDDFVPRDGDSCYQTNYCPDNGCRGEEVTKISTVAEHIPALSYWPVPSSRR